MESRMLRHGIVLLLTCMAGLLGAAENAIALDAPPTVDDFACLDHRGRMQRLSEQTDVGMVVVISATVGCPILRQLAVDISDLAQTYANQGVRVWYLNANTQDSRADIVADANGLGITQPILLDSAQVVSEMLGITRACEALVIRSKDRVLLWRGPINDRAGYGTQKAAPTQHFLRDAITALVAGKKPAGDAPDVKGCAISYAKPRDKHIPDYSKDVAPLLQRECFACHRSGGIGPFAMSSYDKVKGWSAMMREVVLARRMTPWHADPEYGTFSNDRGLSDDERRTLIHWVDQGSQRGTGLDPLASKAATPAPEWPLGKPDLIVELPAQNIPANGLLPYRVGTIDLPLPKNVWVRGVDLRPSDARVLHHAFLFYGQMQVDDLPPDTPPALRDWLKNLSPEQIQKLAKEHGRADENATGLTTFFAAYVPGAEPRFFPKDTGKKLDAHTTLKFQLHYTTMGEAVTDRPKVGLYFMPKPPKHTLRITSAVDLRFAIPPGAREHPVEATRGFEQDATLYALTPHMHYRGASMRFTAVYPDGKREVLLSVPDYDMDWQTTYYLATPKRIPAGTTITVDGTFDNSASNPKNPDPTRLLRFGEQTEDEMFIGYMLFSD